MASYDHERLTRLFYEVVHLPAEARAAFLDRSCADESGLRGELESLLQVAARQSCFEERTPEKVGPFHLVERIGEGGMGVVYRAEQRNPIRRQAAVKLIRSGYETEEVLRRFDSERQSLALMEHPCIARILDVGTTDDGRPYFAMEYVDGVPITRYCDGRGLGLDERLELVAQVCAGVQHAHQNAVIHRDLKPSNVLVVEIDGVAVPKIIDFGIAKALRTPAAREQGEIGHSVLMGTPAYMSPEQLGTGQGVDTRTDVYSLGVLLYELLGGELPFDEKDGPRLRVRGELQAIVTKALAFDPRDRYASAAELAADLRRYRGHEPVAAMPPSTTYHIRKFVRRHRTGTALASIIVALLFAALAIDRIQSGRVRAERDRAEQAAEFLARFYESPWLLADRHSTPTAEEVLVVGADRIKTELDADPLLQARMAFALGQTLRAIDPERSGDLLSLAVRTFDARLGHDHPRSQSARSALAESLTVRSEFAAAEALLTETLEQQRRRAGVPDHGLLKTLVDLGYLYKRARQDERAVQLLEEALAGMESLLGPRHHEALLTAGLLASVYLDLGRLAEAEALLNATLIHMTAVEHPEKNIVIYNLACAHALRGQRDLALTRLEEAVNRGFSLNLYSDPKLTSLQGDPAFAVIARRARFGNRSFRNSVTHRARACVEERRYAEAAALYEFALGAISRYAVPSAEASDYRTWLSEAYLHTGQYREAAALATEELDKALATRSSNPRRAPLLLWQLLQAHLGLGETDAARGVVGRLEASATGFQWPAIASYARACRAALDGRTEAALEELEAAVPQGFDRPRWMEFDLALRPLRTHDRFRRVLSLLRERYDSIEWADGWHAATLGSNEYWPTRPLSSVCWCSGAGVIANRSRPARRLWSRPNETVSRQ